MHNPKFNIGDIFYYASVCQSELTETINQIAIEIQTYKIVEIIYNEKNNIFYTLITLNDEREDTFRLSEEELDHDLRIFKSKESALESIINTTTQYFNNIITTTDNK